MALADGGKQDQQAAVALFSGIFGLSYKGQASVWDHVESRRKSDARGLASAYFREIAPTPPPSLPSLSSRRSASGSASPQRQEMPRRWEGILAKVSRVSRDQRGLHAIRWRLETGQEEVTEADPSLNGPIFRIPSRR